MADRAGRRSGRLLPAGPRRARRDARPGSERADALEEAARTALEFTNQHINPMFPIDYMRGVEDGAVKIVAAIRDLPAKEPT